MSVVSPVSILRKALPHAIATAALMLPAALPALAQSSGMLEEVIVTAAKRQQTLQEIPIAVSVVTAETIEQAQVLDIKDLQTLVPSLRVTQLQGSAQTNFIIRGFGNGANNAGIEPSVGVFIDAPRSAPAWVVPSLTCQSLSESRCSAVRKALCSVRTRLPV